jgi:hypothetical protein
MKSWSVLPNDLAPVQATKDMILVRHEDKIQNSNLNIQFSLSYGQYDRSTVVGYTKETRRQYISQLLSVFIRVIRFGSPIMHRGLQIHTMFCINAKGLYAYHYDSTSRVSETEIVFGFITSGV